MDKQKFYNAMLDQIATETISTLKEFFPPKKGRRVEGDFGYAEAAKYLSDKLVGPAPVKRTRKTKAPAAVAAEPKKRGPKPKVVAKAAKTVKANPGPKTKSNGDRLSPTAKAEVSKRMKAYWAAKRAEKANNEPAKQAAAQ